MSKKAVFTLLASISLHAMMVLAVESEKPTQQTVSMGSIQAPVAINFATVTKPVPKPILPTPKKEPVKKKLLEKAKPVLDKVVKKAEPPKPEPKLEEPVQQATAKEVAKTAGLNEEPVMVSEPAIRHWVEPKYPRMARRRNQQGVVMLDVVVDEQGEPISIQILKSSGYAALDKAAQLAVQQWEFKPEQRDEQFVKSRVHIPVSFVIS